MHKKGTKASEKISYASQEKKINFKSNLKFANVFTKKLK